MAQGHAQALGLIEAWESLTPEERQAEKAAVYEHAHVWFVPHLQAVEAGLNQLHEVIDNGAHAKIEMLWQAEEKADDILEDRFNMKTLEIASKGSEWISDMADKEHAAIG